MPRESEGMTMRIDPSISSRRARVLGAVCALVLLPTLAHAAPEVGQPAPDFRFEGLAGDALRSFSLSDYVGESARKKGVVVAWFPKAFTPG